MSTNSSISPAAPKKLIRSSIVNKLQPEEYTNIEDPKELNELYALKIREELTEIQAADHKDILEFADLVEVSLAFAEANGFTRDQVLHAMAIKVTEKGAFGNLALTNLNPANPSNALYF